MRVILLIVYISFQASFSYSGSAINIFLPEGKKIITDTVSPDSSLVLATISRTWKLPDILQRVSGFDFIDKNRIACVQDAVGSIFIFNLRSRKIEKQIPFAPPGDYASICIAGSTAFIASSDGRIIEVARYLSPKPLVTEYGTHLTSRQNPEGICYDRSAKRLLVSIQGVEEGGMDFKGIYEFDLKSRKLQVKPAIRIDLSDSALNPGNSKKLQQLLQPSDISINARNGNLYLCDATKAQLVIINNRGVIKKLIGFPRSEIIQPEGIRLTPSGELYIVSGGSKDEPGKLLLIEIPAN